MSSTDLNSTNTAKRDLLTLLDCSAEEIEAILAMAVEHKRNRLSAEPNVFAGRSGALIFEKPSLRTRVSFETAINELGGHAIMLVSEMTGMGSRETIADIARNLERWVHLVVFRTYSQDRLLELARSCSAPVINALTDSYHPCQALAFGMTLRERIGESRTGSIVFVGDGNNVCTSIMIMCATLGYDFVVACAEGYEPPGDLVAVCRERAEARGATVGISHSPSEAVTGAMAIYTDVWASMGQEGEAARRARDFAEFQINEALLEKAPAGVLISHCLPAHRGEEITDGVLDSVECMAFDEAENRLHVQKAVIRHLLS